MVLELRRSAGQMASSYVDESRRKLVFERNLLFMARVGIGSWRFNEQVEFIELISPFGLCPEKGGNLVSILHMPKCSDIGRSASPVRQQFKNPSSAFALETRFGIHFAKEVTLSAFRSSLRARRIDAYELARQAAKEHVEPRGH